MIAICLFVFSDKLGNVDIALGLAGAGIAFALQEVITSFAGWISILLGQEQKLVSVLKLTTSLEISLT
jgi:small-conductance mechanosensitive channel